MAHKRPYPTKLMTFWANDTLLQQLKSSPDLKHGGIAEALNEGLRLYLETQAEHTGGKKA